MKKLIYVGIDSDGFRWVFRPDAKPTFKTHAHQFAACIGPFRTVRGANFMRDHGRNNPHCQTVAAAERLSKK